MFAELSTLVRASEKVVLTLAMHGDALSVVVMPVAKKAEDPALAAPLAISGSPEELDDGFVEALQSYVATRRSLAEQVEATNSILEAAKASQSTKATEALTKAAAPGSAATETDDDEGKPAAPVQPTESQSSSAGTDLASLL